MSVSVTAKVHAFAEPVCAEIEHGHSLKYLSADANVYCAVNGEHITDLSYITEPGDTVLIVGVPQDDGGQLIATFAILALAAWAGPAAAGALNITSTFGVKALTVGAHMLGALAVSALVKPDTAKDEVQPTGIGRNQITGAANRANHWGVVPRLYGERGYYPPLAAMIYTEIAGAEQFARILLCLGYGPLQVGGLTASTTQTITDQSGVPDGAISIGGVDINQITGAEYEIGHIDNISLYTRDINELSPMVDFPLAAGGEGGWFPDGTVATLRTEPDTDEVSLDLTFPSGIWNAGSDGKTTGYAAVKFKLEYQPAAGGGWTTIIDPWLIEQVTKDPARFSYKFKFPTPGEYDIRITRVESFTQQRNYISMDAVLTAFRSIKYESSWNGDHILMALRVRATDQIKGNIGQIKVKAKSIIPTWNGSSWVDAATDNPAYIYRHALSGGHLKRPVSTANIDDDVIKAWATFCSSNTLRFDYVFDGDDTVMDRLRIIAATGYATPDIVNGKYTVVRDRDDLVPVQAISPRNSWGFRATKVFSSLPHGIRVSYDDENTGETDQVIAYRDGFTADNATKFEDLQLPGVVDQLQAWSAGRYFFNQAILRPERFRVSMDFEALVAQRGARVYLSHDVLLVGLKWGRVKSFIADPATSITLDEEVIMETGKNYGIRVRRADNTYESSQVSTVAGVSITLTPSASITVADGDLVLFGELGLETIDAIVMGVSNNQDLSVDLELADYSSDILDFGVTPTYDPHITIPPDVTEITPATPRVEFIESGTAGLYRDLSGNLKSSIVVSYSFPAQSTFAEDIECKYRVVGSEKYLLISDKAEKGSIRISDVEEGQSIEFAIRAVSPWGKYSAWTSEFVETVVGKLEEPSDVDNFQVSIQGNQIRLDWDRIPDPDADTYIIKVGGSDWSTAATVAEVAGNYYLHNPSAATETYWIKAVDVTGRESVNAVSVTFSGVAPTLGPIIPEVIDNNVLLRWTATAGTFEIDRFEVVRGASFASPDLNFGSVSGTFAALFETTSGTYTYRVRPIDKAGIIGNEQTITATVSEPPDFVLRDNYDSDFSGTKTNADSDGNSLFLPVDTAETWTQHFTNNTWNTIQDQIDAGYPFYAEPTLSSGSYKEQIDYGVELNSSKINLTLTDTQVDGTRDVTPKIRTADDNAGSPGTWTDHGNVWSAFATGFRFAEITLTAASTGGDDLIRFDNVNVKISVKLITDEGTGTANSGDSGGTTVNFNLSFLDVSSITVTPKGTTARFAIYDFVDVPNPTSFSVYLFDNNGTRVSGDFSWTARGTGV